MGSFSTVVKQFVIDYTRETQDPLMEHEVNGLDYRYVYGNKRLSVNISPIENGAGSVVESGTVGQQIRLYYHQDLRGTVDYLTSPVSQKVESWTHYNEWGEITHNAVLKMGQRELDLVKNYTGHDFDAVLNMYYAKARMYDAENRRFVALDPIMDGSVYDISERVTDPMMFVQYLYVKDNPLVWIDKIGYVAYKLGDTTIQTINHNGKDYASLRDLIAAYGGSLSADPITRTYDSGTSTFYHGRAGLIDFYFYTQTASRPDRRLSIVAKYNNWKTDNIYSEDIWFNAEAGANYVSIEYFQKIMCELGYTKELKEAPITDTMDVFANNNQWSAYNKLSQAQQETNAKFIYEYLTQQGWTLEAIAGLLGNIAEEGVFNPGAWGSKNHNPDDSTIGYDLVQETPARKFLNWANLSVSEVERLASGSTDDVRYLMSRQLDYLIAGSVPTSSYDIRAWYPTMDYGAPFKMTFTEFIQAGSTYDVGDLALVFHSHYERSNDSAKD